MILLMDIESEELLMTMLPSWSPTPAELHDALVELAEHDLVVALEEGDRYLERLPAPPPGPSPATWWALTDRGRRTARRLDDELGP